MEIKIIMDWFVILLLAITSSHAENKNEYGRGINKIESRYLRSNLDTAQSIKRNNLYTDDLDSLEIPKDEPEGFSVPEPTPTFQSLPAYPTPSPELSQTPSPDFYQKLLSQYPVSPTFKTSVAFEPNPVILRQEIPRWVTKTITRDFHIPVLVPIPVEKHVPIPVKVPYAVPVDRPVAVPVQVPVEVTKNVPVYYEKKVPYPVKVPVSVPVPYPVEKQVPVDRPVYIDRPVPQPVYVERQVNVPYPVQVDRPVPVPHPVYFEKKVPVPFITPASQAIIYQKMLEWLNNNNYYSH